MGWTGVCDRRPAVDIVRDELTSGNEWTIVANRGAKYWVLEKGDTRLAVTVLTRREDGWLYTKVIDEDMGPYDYNFPVRFLDLLDEPRTEFASEWREKVREHHASKKAQPKLIPGVTVVFETPLEFTHGVGKHDRLTYLGKYRFRTPTGVFVRLNKSWRTNYKWSIEG